MELPHDPDSLSRLAHGLVITAIVIAGLYFGRDLLMPVALAILLGFVLQPIVTQLKRWGVPRVLAVAIVGLTTLAFVIAAGLFVASQLRALGKELPVYQANISHKLKEFHARLREPGVVDQLTRVFGAVERELTPPPPKAPSAEAKREEPARVEMVPAAPTPLERIGEWLDSLATYAAMTAIVIVFVVLILLDRGDLRDRMLRLLGDNLHRTTDALDEATERVSRYLLMQLVANVAYGLPLAAGLFLIGVPGALLWGLLAALLRFVPYLGPAVAAVFPLTLAFAVDPGWSMLLWTLGLILTLELVGNNIVEPLLFSTSTGLSTLSVIMSATFWTTLWGPAGLILSTPLTVVLMVMGRYLPQLRFFDVLLGSEPPLDQPTRLYQRLLADDVEEAVELATEQAERSSPSAFYAEVGVAALRLASGAHATVATPDHRHRLVSGMTRVIEELREQYPADAALDAQVVCIGGRWELDALAADMAAHALALQGYPSRVARAGEVSARDLAGLDLSGVKLVCLSYFSPSPSLHAKHFVRRLKVRWPDVRVVLALWNAPELLSASDLLERTGADALAGSIEELVASVESMLAKGSVTPHAPAPIPEDDRERVAALRASGLFDEATRPTLDAIAKRTADVFDCPLALVSLVDEHWEIIRGRASGLGRLDPGAAESRTPREDSVCAHVVAAAAPLVVPDVARDPRFAANPWLRERGIRFYAGAPLRGDDGHALGTLCILDTEPRTLSPRDVLLLESMAAEVMTAVRKQADLPANAATT